LVASKTFGRIKLIESKGDRESWVNKKANVWKELKKLGKNSKYWWGSEMENFILLLFPQIKEDFLELKSRIPMSATAPMSPLGAQLKEPRSAPIMEPFGDHLMEPGQR